MSVAGLFLLWLTPPAVVIGLIIKVPESIEPAFGLWSALTRSSLVLVLFVVAIYTYVYSGITLWRTAAWIGAGRRVLDAQNAAPLRPLGLYLRPFAADQRPVVFDSAVYPFSERPELSSEPLAWLLEKLPKTSRNLDGTHLDQFLGPMFRRYIGELIALGDPRDWLPRRGAARLYPVNRSGIEWQTIVMDLLKKSHVVILLAGESSGLVWELRYLRQHIPARRVIMVTPPASATSTWIMQAQALADAGWSIPTCDPGPGCVIAFDETYGTLLLRRGARGPQEYIAVIAAHLRGEVGAEVVPWPTKPVQSLPSILNLD
jgi:hypothetical protein